MNKGILLATGLILAIAFSACDSPIGQGAGYGAAGGAVIGGLAGGTVRSAAIGSAAGAGLGALVGAVVEENERERYYTERPEGGYPYGQPTEYRGIVRSPYYPHNLIDVAGIPHGSMVVDPSTNQVFIRP
jgi:Glycine zipper